MKITGMAMATQNRIWVGTAIEGNDNFMWFFSEDGSGLSLQIEDKVYATMCRARQPDETWSNRIWRTLGRPEWPAGLEETVRAAIRGQSSRG
jgi:hypothetical protein